MDASPLPFTVPNSQHTSPCSKSVL